MTESSDCNTAVDFLPKPTSPAVQLYEYFTEVFVLFRVVIFRYQYQTHVSDLN